jgi:hypothetical protein
MDADGDGKVSTEEFVQFAEKREPPLPIPAPPSR